MPLIPCAACGHQIAHTARACPRCGADGPGRSSRWAETFGGVLGIVLATLAGGGLVVAGVGYLFAEQLVVILALGLVALVVILAAMALLGWATSIFDLF